MTIAEVSKRLNITQKEILDNKIKTMQEESKKLQYKINFYNEGKLEES